MRSPLRYVMPGFLALSCGIASLDLSGCGGSSGPASNSIPTVVAATPTPTASPAPAASSSITTAALTSGSPITLPNIGGYGGSVTYTAASGTTIPSGTTVQLQTFVGAPAGAPAPQAALRRIMSLTPSAVAAFEAVFSTGISLAGSATQMQFLIPNAGSASLNAETYDATTGNLIASIQGTPSGNGTYTFTSTGTTIVVVPNRVYITLLVANSLLSPSPSATAAPSATGSPAAGATSTPQPASSATASASATPTAAASASPVPSASPALNVQIVENGTQGQLGGLAVASTGTVYAIDDAKSSIDIFNGGGVSRVGISGAASVQGVFTPSGFAWPAIGIGGNLWFPHTATNSIGTLNLSTLAVNDIAIPTTQAGPIAIVQGSDGAMWFTEQTAGKIGRIDASNTVTEIPLPSGTTTGPTQLVVGPDNALWINEDGVGRIARMPVTATPANPQVTEYSQSSPGCVQQSLTSGPLNSLWYIGCAGSFSAQTIVQLDTSGHATPYAFPSGIAADPRFITTGNDGALWFTDQNKNYIGRMVPQGAGIGTWTTYPYSLVNGNGAGNAAAGEIAPGIGSSLYWVEFNTGNIGELTY